MAFAEFATAPTSGTFTDTRSQTLATVFGQAYTLDFFAENDASPNPATIQAYFGGTAVTASPVTPVASGEVHGVHLHGHGDRPVHDADIRLRWRRHYAW